MKKGYKKWIIFLTAAVLGILAAFAAAGSFSVVLVEANCMAPAISQGERLLVNKWSYRSDSPQRGDVVAFSCKVYSEDGEGSTLVRRVAAVEGDRVEIKGGAFYVNGQVYDDHAAGPVYMEDMEKIRIAKGNVFVLSDSRTAVLDSRDQAVGQLKVSELLGKVCFK